MAGLGGSGTEWTAAYWWNEGCCGGQRRED